jgi:hypothetical protein
MMGDCEDGSCNGHACGTCFGKWLRRRAGVFAPEFKLPPMPAMSLPDAAFEFAFPVFKPKRPVVRWRPVVEWVDAG